MFLLSKCVGVLPLLDILAYNYLHFLLVYTPRDEFVFDKLGSGDASDSDWTSWFQLLPYNKECVCLPVVKHSNTGRLRQEGTLHSVQLRGLLNGTVIREKPKGFFSLLLNLTRLKWTFNKAILTNSRTCLEEFNAVYGTTAVNVMI